MKTLAFYAVFGLVPGYNHNNYVVHKVDGVENLVKIDLSRDQIVAEIWQEEMQKEFDNSGILVPAVFGNSLTVYPVGFGCPKGGEHTVTVNGHVNPKFFDQPCEEFSSKELWNFKRYKEAVVRVCSKVKVRLKQTTVSIGFYQIQDFVYVSGDKT